MLDAITWLALTGSMVAHTAAAICFKISAQQSLRKKIVGYFVLGNAIGFFNPVCMAIALKDNNANVVLATMGAVGGIFFIVVLNRVFNERLTLKQWLAIGVCLLGSLILQIPASSPSDESQSRDVRQPHPSISLVTSVAKDRI